MHIITPIITIPYVIYVIVATWDLASARDIPFCLWEVAILILNIILLFSSFRKKNGLEVQENPQSEESAVDPSGTQ